MRNRLVMQPDTSDSDPPGEYLCQGGGHDPLTADYLVPVSRTVVLPLCHGCALRLFDNLNEMLFADEEE